MTSFASAINLRTLAPVLLGVAIGVAVGAAAFAQSAGDAGAQPAPLTIRMHDQTKLSPEAGIRFVRFQGDEGMCYRATRANYAQGTFATETFCAH